MALKLHYSVTSPFVRKVMISAIELGLEGRIEKLPAQVSPVNRNQAVIADNPLGQVPTLVEEDGTAIHDSRVIAEYLDQLAGGGRLFPNPGAARWRALTEQSLADGLLDAALLLRYETVLRPPAFLWAEWRDGQFDKIVKSADRLELMASALRGRVDIGAIAIGCALGYLDFRFPALDWSSQRPNLAGWYGEFAERPSMAATRPHG